MALTSDELRTMGKEMIDMGRKLIEAADASDAAIEALAKDIKNEEGETEAKPEGFVARAMRKAEDNFEVEQAKLRDEIAKLDDKIAKAKAKGDKMAMVQVIPERDRLRQKLRVRVAGVKYVGTVPLGSGTPVPKSPC